MTRTQRTATAVLACSALAVAALLALAAGKDSSVEDAGAQYDLGLKYATGEGVPEDNAEAVRWYRMAAEQGDFLAQFSLGVMYDTGAGVPENYVLAYAWFNLAAVQGYEEVVSRKADLQRRMTAAQIAEAQELSATLFARINGGG